MTEDRSLDDFVDASEDRQAGADGEEDDGDASDTTTSDDAALAEMDADVVDDTTDESVSPEAVEQARPTYDWSPESVECETCGTSVDRRWRQESALVCEDCKDW